MSDLQDRVALRELVDRYASGVDHRDSAAVAALFTEDGVLAIHLPGEDTPRRTHRGRTAIAATMDGLRRFRVTSHVVANQLLEVGDDDRATGETYCTAHHVYDTDDGPRMYVMWIRYEDTFVRVDGRWLVAERRLRTDITEDRAFAPSAG